MPKVEAVVVTYNRKEMLIQCLDAILNQTSEVDKVIVIDNNSTDNTPDYLKEKGYLDNEKIFFQKLEKNTGGAGGFYKGK